MVDLTNFTQFSFWLATVVPAPSDYFQRKPEPREPMKAGPTHGRGSPGLISDSYQWSADAFAFLMRKVALYERSLTHKARKHSGP